MLAFLDCEASSLLQHLSYPTEIGWVAHDFSAGFVALVRPEPDWDDWNAEAEAVTNLSRAAIEQYGEPVGQVARALNEMLAGADVLTDNPACDGRWLRRLYFAADVTPSFPVFEAATSPQPGASVIFDADRLILQAIDMAQAEYKLPLLPPAAEKHERLVQQITVGAGLGWHRALDDALMLAIGLAAVDLLPLEEEALRAGIDDLILRVRTAKVKIIGGAVARHIHAGGRDADGLCAVLER